jgi:hypothetical protein
MTLPDFDPFEPYYFADSQKPENKYGIARSWFEPPERFAETAPFAPFDIRRGSAQEMLAYWVNVPYRLRVEGWVIFRRLAEALQDAASQRMLHVFFTTPPTAARFHWLVAAARRALVADEAARLRLIRNTALATFWGGSPLKYLPESQRQEAIERSDALWQQDVACRPQLALQRLPVEASKTEIVAVCHFLFRMAKKEGMIRVESYLPGPRWQDGPSLFADPFLDFALTQASQTWRERPIIRLNIVQREKANLYELARRLDALAAFFTDLLSEQSTPDSLFWRMNSFWPEDVFPQIEAARHYGKEEASMSNMRPS